MQNVASVEPKLRIKRIAVTGLFKRFNHVIHLHVEERITIIHGPNGVGKTVLLRLANALAGLDYFVLARFPFNCLEIQFTDGGMLSVTQHGGTSNDGAMFVDLEVEHLDADLSGKLREGRNWALPGHTVSALANQSNAWLPWVQRLSQNLWYDQLRSDQIDAATLLSRYSSEIPTPMRKQLLNEPEWLTTLCSRIAIHFIETQRLIEVGQKPDGNSISFGRGPSITYAVHSLSADLVDRMTKTLNVYAGESQRLDQSFPHRLLGMEANDQLSSNEIVDRLEKINHQRTGLERIGLLDGSTADQSIDREKIGNKLDAMTQYVRDYATKLSTLENLSRHLSLMLEIVNGKFLYKKVGLSRARGVVVTDDSGRVLDVNDLSSGEQHELVLAYDLLFRVPENALVLIDEPELSLHVEWQSVFLDDLAKVVKENHFDVLVATHSPYIVNERNELMVALSAGQH